MSATAPNSETVRSRRRVPTIKLPPWFEKELVPIVIVLAALVPFGWAAGSPFIQNCVQALAYIVMALGLNRSELFTRRGMSPSVRLPRVLGIECVGLVERSSDPALPESTTVAAAMGGMGRQFDGSYAEYALLPTSQLMPVTSELPWSVLGAVPETLQTAHGSLTTGLDLQPGQTLLIRGGTSSLGFARTIPHSTATLIHTRD